MTHALRGELCYELLCWKASQISWHLRRELDWFSIMNREGTQRLTEWSPSRFFSSERPNHPFALILLNQPLNWTAFEKIFGSGKLLSQYSPYPDKNCTDSTHTASLTICADGGANRLHMKSSMNGFSNPYVGIHERHIRVLHSAP